MFGKQRDVFVYNKTKETFLAFRVKVADSIFGRLIGLLGRRSLQPDSGVWIVPANAVHTIGMLFTFDLVLVDKNFKVVGLRELVRPFRITLPERKAESVLELPAHTIFRSRTQVGDQLLIERYEARKPSKIGIAGPVGVQAPPAEIEPAAQRQAAVPIAPQSSRARFRAQAWRQPKFANSVFVRRAIRIQVARVPFTLGRTGVASSPFRRRIDLASTTKPPRRVSHRSVPSGSLSSRRTSHRTYFRSSFLISLGVGRFTSVMWIESLSEYT